MHSINLTVGEVAGLISGCISLRKTESTRLRLVWASPLTATVHIVIPLLFAFILVGIVRDRSFDAVTWSSISHLLQGSLWPLLLQSDSAAGNVTGKVVRWRVFAISSLVTFVTACLIAANFLTPKPLYDQISPSSDLHDVEFSLAPDPSYYGRATLERETINRRCGWNQYMDCPHTIYDDPIIRNQYANYTVINSTIPAVTQDLFTSGTQTGTVANLLDVEFRAYSFMNKAVVDNNASKPVGRLEVLPSMILNPGYHLVNGLIVDAFRGGVGIRNHTVPKGMALGATWTEDILWVIPETRCTNTNLSLHFSVNDASTTSMAGYDGSLQDDGGFSDISPEVPQPQWNVGDQWRTVGPTPQLKRRADILAWWNNQFVAQVLNLTSSRKGAIYKDQLVTFGQLSQPGTIKISGMDGLFLDSLYFNFNATAEFKEYGVRCSGYKDDDPNVAGHPFMQCGYLYTIPEPQNIHLGQSWRPDPGSRWQQNLYTCASSVSAQIKVVTFGTNGSTAFEALQVINVQDKNYTAANLPLWGIEKVDPKKYQIHDVYKFWGLVDESVGGRTDVDAHRASKIYLPATVRIATLGHMWDSFAAGVVLTAAWNSVYSLAAALSDVNAGKIPSYSGASNYGLTLKWRQLNSQSTPGAETLLNLIWTDLVAFTIVGTRTGFGDEDKPGSLGVRRVHRYERSVRYGDIRFAIPAFIVGAFLLVTLVISLLMCCFQRRMWSALNHYMNQTSMGRAVTQTTLHGGPDEISVYASTKEWSHQAKHIMLQVPPPPSKENKQISNVSKDGEPSTAQVAHGPKRPLSDESELSRVADTAGVEHPSTHGSPALEDPRAKSLKQRTW